MSRRYLSHTFTHRNRPEVGRSVAFFLAVAAFPLDTHGGSPQDPWGYVNIRFQRYFTDLNTSPGEGLRITRPGGGGGIFCPPLLSRLPETLETRNFGDG